LVSSPLLKRKKEKRPILVERPADGEPILSTGKGWLGNGSKGIASLIALVTQEPKHVAVEIVCAALGDHVYYATRGKAKFGGERIGNHLKFLHRLLTYG